MYQLEYPGKQSIAIILHVESGVPTPIAPSGTSSHDTASVGRGDGTLSIGSAVVGGFEVVKIGMDISTHPHPHPGIYHGSRPLTWHCNSLPPASPSK